MLLYTAESAVHSLLRYLCLQCVYTALGDNNCIGGYNICQIGFRKKSLLCMLGMLGIGQFMSMTKDGYM